MAGIQRFEDLIVWQKARELVGGVYRAAGTQKLGRDWGLVAQMKRAAVSVVSNIAEGHERGSRAEYVHFCHVAKGSAGELRAQTIVAHDVGLIDQACHDWLCAHCEEVSAMLSGYIRHLRDTSTSLKSPKLLPARGRKSLAGEELLAGNGRERPADHSAENNEV